MLRLRALPLVLVLTVGTQAAAPPVAAATNDDLQHTCVVEPQSATCADWLADHPPVNDPTAPVCRYRGSYVPCQSPIDFRGKLGWWVGDILDGPGWTYLWRNGEARRIDDPANGGGPLGGCWAWLYEHTGPDRPSPLVDGAEGTWYQLLCLGDQPYSDEINLVTLPGFHGELRAWRRTGPAGDPVQAARNARADLDIQDPRLRTAPPPGRAVPLGMPVWLAVDDDPQAAWWGPLTGNGCHRGLCVDIRAEVDQLEWELGDGTTVTCTPDQNTAWRPGMEYLHPTTQICHHYYDAPSRDEPDGHYPIRVTVHWHTHWQAPTLGLTSGDDPLRHTQTSTTTMQVNEIQVLVGNDD